MLRILFYFLLVVANVAFADNNNGGFLYQHQPIKPACVALFNDFVNDLPYLTSVNLDACEHSQNTITQNTHQGVDGSYYFFNNNLNNSAGRYAYTVMGKTSNGIFVLKTDFTTGGSMDANELLLVKLDQRDQWVISAPGAKPQINKINELTLVGYWIGGDRCVGNFDAVTVMGNTLRVNEKLGSPTSCSNGKAYSLDLSALNA